MTLEELADRFHDHYCVKDCRKHNGPDKWMLEQLTALVKEYQDQLDEVVTPTDIEGYQWAEGTEEDYVPMKRGSPKLKDFISFLHMAAYELQERVAAFDAADKIFSENFDTSGDPAAARIAELEHVIETLRAGLERKHEELKRKDAILAEVVVRTKRIDAKLKGKP